MLEKALAHTAEEDEREGREKFERRNDKTGIFENSANLQATG